VKRKRKKKRKKKAITRTENAEEGERTITQPPRANVPESHDHPLTTRRYFVFDRVRGTEKEKEKIKGETARPMTKMWRAKSRMKNGIPNPGQKSACSKNRRRETLNRIAR